MSSKSQRIATEAHHASPATRMATSEDKPGGRLLKREAVAEMLGASVSTVRRLEKTVLPPLIIKGVRAIRARKACATTCSARGTGAET